jgi:C2 domain of PTEN tumour-suppressor protein
LQYAKGPPRDNLPPPPDDAKSDYDPDYLLMGCAPYLQIFKAGQLIFTTAATLHYNQAKDELPFCQVADGQISFHVEIVIQGDILVRCRHLTSQGQRISMFRAAFHTGYVPPNVMRLTKEQLDGACRDKRFPDDFFVDLIFEPCVAEMASKHISGKADATEGQEDSAKSGDTDSQNEASLRRERGTISGAANSSMVSPKAGEGAIVTASAYDSMLHRDSRFWDVIAARRQEHAQQESSTSTIESMHGPTIGRRRRFDEPSNSNDSQQENDGANSKSGEKSMPMFSIGGGFELESKSLKHSDSTKASSQEVSQPKERDELMDALNAIDDVESPVFIRNARLPLTEDVSSIVKLPSSNLFEDTKVCPNDSNMVPENHPTNKSLQEQDNQDAIEIAESSNMNTAVQEATALLGITDLTEDMDDLLAAGEAEDADTGDLDDFDFDDDDLNDLETFLTSK